MSNTSDELRELRDDELDGVSGGLDYCKLYPDKCVYLPPPPPPPPFHTL